MIVMAANVSVVQVYLQLFYNLVSCGHKIDIGGQADAKISEGDNDTLS